MSLYLNGPFDLTSPNFFHAAKKRFFGSSSNHSELLHCKQTHHPTTIAVCDGPHVSPATTSMADKLFICVSQLYLTNEMQMILNTTCGKVTLISWTSCSSLFSDPRAVPPSSLRVQNRPKTFAVSRQNFFIFLFQFICCKFVSRSAWRVLIEIFCSGFASGVLKPLYFFFFVARIVLAL